MNDWDEPNYKSKPDLKQPAGEWPPYLRPVPADTTISVGLDTANTGSNWDRNTGLTLDELAEFVDTARNLNVPGDQVIRVRVGWRAQILRIHTGP